MAKSPTIPKALKDAAKGLLFPSEADAPLEPFAWPAGRVDAAGVRAQTGTATTTPVEELTPSQFFRAVPTTLRARYFDLLLAFVDHLAGVKVFKFGNTQVTAYIVGTTADGLRAGVKIELVET
jgi:hypothetical protein